MKEQIKEKLKDNKVRGALVVIAIALAELLGPEEAKLVSIIIDAIG